MKDDSMDFLDDLFGDFPDEDKTDKKDQPQEKEEADDDAFDFLNDIEEEPKETEEPKKEEKPAEPVKAEKTAPDEEDASESVGEPEPLGKPVPKEEESDISKETPKPVEEPKVEVKEKKKPEPKKAEKKSEKKEEEPIPEPEIEVTVKEEKPKRRTRKTKEKPVLKGDILKDTEELDPSFMQSLLVLPGDEFKKQMNHIVELMNEIDLPKDLDAANAKIMYSKNFYLGREIDSVSFAWHNMYESLTNKDFGLIKKVKDQARLKTEGTKDDKDAAAMAAIANYTYNGKTIDLSQYANALRAANNFLMNAKEFQKTTGMVLSSFVKLQD